MWEKADKVYEEAVEDTSGQVLTYNGELKLVPYHQISAGQTRDGETAFHNEEYAYLKAVDSNSDKTAPGYLNSTLHSEAAASGGIKNCGEGRQRVCGQSYGR